MDNIIWYVFLYFYVGGTCRVHTKGTRVILGKIPNTVGFWLNYAYLSFTIIPVTSCCFKWRLILTLRMVIFPTAIFGLLLLFFVISHFTIGMPSA